MLWCLMNNEEVRQSEFNFEDLERYGWITVPNTPSALEAERSKIAPLYEEFGFDTESELNWGHIHDDWGQDADGNPNEGTVGVYQNTNNVLKGYIIAFINLSPAESTVPVAVLPPLQKWSDVVALQWQNDADGQRLNYVVRAHIANWNTRMCIYNALRDAGQVALPTWPGFDVTINEDGTNALAHVFWGLLGTYHGAAPAYMLAQHRNIFGHKTVAKIRIWDSEKPWPISSTIHDLYGMSPNILLYIDDVAS
ncbi:hypothetical protein F4808DRAFT_126183 [Astrocystis sublimbata]|nr:hypothetical protein F4808DRAFT_126183 [Astrocystis sublimbata]